MKVVVQFLCVVLCAGCGSVRTPQPAPAPQGKIISLPKVPVEGVDYSDGISGHEAQLVAAEYFRRIVGSCGMPDEPLDSGEFWSIQLWGGYAGADSGRLLLAKNGSKLLFQPPAGGLGTSTKVMLQYLGVKYE